MLAELATIFTALALGGLLKGAIGAGTPVVAVPVLALFFDVPTAVTLMVIPNLFSNLWQGTSMRRHVLPARFTWSLAGAGAIGVVLGTWFLVSVPSDTLLLGTAIMVFGYIGFRLARPHWRLSREIAGRIVWPTGIVAGGLQGATGISAPVSLPFLNAMGLPRETFMATISVFFAVLSIAQMPFLWYAGLLDARLFAYGTAAILPLLLFMPVGNYIAGFIPPKVFDRVILVLLALIAVRMILKALA